MRRAVITATAMLALVLAPAAPAAADHTDPDAPLSPLSPAVPGDPGVRTGEGTWQFIQNFPPNQGSDLWLFNKGGSTYMASGTLGQGQGTHAGQRITRLIGTDGTVDPEWVADHGSAACPTVNPGGTTGLQHDVFTTPPGNPELMLDATDATSRCHDPDGGGIEIIDISGLGTTGFEVREVHLVRFNATTHTITRDDLRPWIVYSNNSAFAGFNWLDVMDIRSCLTQAAGGSLPQDATLEQKRAGCRPLVYRIPFQDEWTQGTLTLDGEPDGAAPGCHDTVSVGTRLHCSGVSGDVIFDMADLTDAQGNIRGTALGCTVIDGTNTGAVVTDCSLGGPTATAGDAREAWEAQGSPQAQGWQFLGNYNHPGRGDPTGLTTGGNTNLNVPADQGIAISHESRPLPAAVGEYMIVSDERGGGVVPGGANCTDENFDQFNHSGLHFFDISDPADIRYAKMVDADGNERERAVWRGQVIRPSPAFCVVHRFHHVPDEQRLIVAYYSQGTKILDYAIDDQGRFSFTEVASFIAGSPGPSGANQWTADVFRVVDNPDGTRTYFIAASDINRGIDIFSWTGAPNPIHSSQVRRLAGPTRIDTANAVSRSQFQAAQVVVLARQDEYADALAGAPLARSLGAPILLTFTNRLATSTAAEIQRLGASRVVLLGGEAAISEAVAQDLRNRGLDVDRIRGANRFDTAGQVADRLGPGTGRAFLAEGHNADPGRGWPDALSVAPYAAHQQRPVLLATRDRLPDETRATLTRLDVTETVVVGGSAAVSDAVVQEITARGHNPRRLSGATRYETSRAVYEDGVAAGMSPAGLWLATGLNWPDALTSGAVVGARGDTLLLVDGQSLDRSASTRDVIRANRERITLVTLLGGGAALSPLVELQVREIVDPQTGHQGGSSGFGGDVLETRAAANAGLALAGLLILPLAAFIGRRRRLHLAR